MPAYTHRSWAHRQRVSTTFLTWKNSHKFFLCSWWGLNSGHWFNKILSPTLYQLSHPTIPVCTSNFHLETKLCNNNKAYRGPCIWPVLTSDRSDRCWILRPHTRTSGHIHLPRFHQSCREHHYTGTCLQVRCTHSQSPIKWDEHTVSHLQNETNTHSFTCKVRFLKWCVFISFYRWLIVYINHL